MATKPKKSVGNDRIWAKATQALEQALSTKDLDYVLDEAGGAFYGPKIDIKIKDAIGRLWQCSTIQLDFNLPERFDMEYTAENGNRDRPVVIHRAMLGSLERFLGVLIEHLSGAFPMWLAPIQAVIVPIADRHNDFCFEVGKRMSDAGFRVEVNDSNDRMNAKIRQAQLQKVPYMLVAGDREVEAQSLAVRTRNGDNIDPMSIDQVIDRFIKQVADRS